MRPARGPRSVLCLRERKLCLDTWGDPRERTENLRCRCHDVAEFEGVGEFLSGDETRYVSDICHQVCPVLISNLAKRLIIPIAGICGPATYYETWLEDACLRGQRGVINELRGRI